MNQTAAGIDCVGDQRLHQVPALSQQEAAAESSTTAQWGVLHMVEEHPLRLIRPAHIAIAEVVERGVGIPGHKDAGQASSLVIPAVFSGKLIGAVIGELVAQRGIFLPSGLPDRFQLYSSHQAGRSPVKPQRFLPVSVPILRSQHMGSDTLCLSRAYSLKLTQANLR